MTPFERWHLLMGRDPRRLPSAAMVGSREEELQKKREEAERKARRGEIDPTHEFTIQVSDNLSLVERLARTWTKCILLT